MSLSLAFIERCRNVPVQLRSWYSRQKKYSSNLNLCFIHILLSGPTTPTISSSNLQTSFFKTSTQNGGQTEEEGEDKLEEVDQGGGGGWMGIRNFFEKGSRQSGLL